MGEGLAALEARVRHDLDILAYPAREWVEPAIRPDGARVENVVIVGAGQAGLAIAFGLQRERVDRVRLIDAAPAGREGPWVTFARMRTLRTQKRLTGLEWGIPSLAFRSWFEAQHGSDAWDDLGRIPRPMWMDYLRWFRDVTGLVAENETRLAAVAPDGGNLRLDLEGPAGPETVFTRKLVLATGVAGSGAPVVPDCVAEGLPPERYAHTSDAIDFDALKGKRIAVVGAGASAFDNAATALEAGAASVDHLVRRRRIPLMNWFRFMEYGSAGFMRHFAELDDARRWQAMWYIFRNATPPPKDTLARCRAHANFRIHLASPLTGAAMDGKALRLTTPEGVIEADFLILGTGYSIDLARLPELSGVVTHIATWADRYTPPADWAHPLIGRCPYLDSGFRLQEKRPGAAPWVRDIAFCTFASTASMGPTGRVSGTAYGIPRLVTGISRDLFMDQADAVLDALRDMDDSDLTGDPLVAARPARHWDEDPD